MVGIDYMEQIALGIDFPSIPYRYEHQLEVLQSWGLGDDRWTDVLWQTPRSLVGLD